MARKTTIDPKLKTVIEDFNSMSEVKYELAKDVYDLQDAETQKVIDKIVATLQTYATGYITAKIGTTQTDIKVDGEYLGFNLLYLAVEIVKDLALLDIQIASFVFPPSMCVRCGAEV